VQLDAYNVDPKSLYELHDTQKEYLSRVVRMQIFSRVKFLPKSGKEHENFWVLLETRFVGEYAKVH